MVKQCLNLLNLNHTLLSNIVNHRLKHNSSYSKHPRLRLNRSLPSARSSRCPSWGRLRAVFVVMFVCCVALFVCCCWCDFVFFWGDGCERVLNEHVRLKKCDRCMKHWGIQRLGPSVLFFWNFPRTEGGPTIYRPGNLCLACIMCWTTRLSSCMKLVMATCIGFVTFV